MSDDPQKDAVARAFVAACADELAAPKPGNVHVFAPGHGMEARDFIESAKAAAGPLTQGETVGARIFGAIEATWGAVAQNTNLGIVLLCAPLAQAVLRQRAGDLRARLSRVLAGLTEDDADLAFRAILLARPAGLGKSETHDVSGPAQTTLLEAMKAAANRDRVAAEYATGFEEIFGAGLPSLRESRSQGLDSRLATLQLFTEFLCAFPDTHIARKYGLETANHVMGEAREFRAGLRAAQSLENAFAAALRFDASLKERGLNPGACADLTVATHFADYLTRILANAGKNG